MINRYGLLSEIQKQVNCKIVHHLIGARIMAPVDELVHIPQFNSRVLIDFVTQTHKSAILVETPRNKPRVTDSVERDEHFILNDKSKIWIDRGHRNRQ